MDRNPTPEYVLGALAEDRVPVALAVKIAQGYAAALGNLNDRALNDWCMAVMDNLGGTACSSTFMTFLACPSESMVKHYNQLAQNYLSQHNKED